MNVRYLCDTAVRIVFLLVFAASCNYAFAQDLVTADVENVVVVPIERLVYELSEDDAVIATCSGILLIVGRTEAAGWFATILGQKATTDFLFEVLTDGLTSGNFSNEELEEAADACIVVMENSKAE